MRSTYTELRHWNAESGWRATAGRRAAAIVLTIAAELIFLLLLLGLNPMLTEKPQDKGSPISIDLSPTAPEPVQHPSAKLSEVAEQRKAPQKPAPPAAPRLPYVPFSRSDMAAADISKLGSNAAKGDSSSQSASADGAGEGPGGAHLYRAEWYKEPSDGQIAFYMPGRIAEGSWAEIACRTVAQYHVEDCVLIGESPVGSGLARALRSASWQFLIRPPRIDGKPLVGSWVRIHFDFDKERKS